MSSKQEVVRSEYVIAPPLPLALFGSCGLAGLVTCWSAWWLAGWLAGFLAGLLIGLPADFVWQDWQGVAPKYM